MMPFIGTFYILTVSKVININVIIHLVRSEHQCMRVIPAR
uniref:Uncharacterized protein n=1 Tax=Anguilla anguilla TaxID=7936 RepID=A0A0E9UJF7_ANGAN